MNTSLVFKVDRPAEDYIAGLPPNGNFFQDDYAFSLLEDIQRILVSNALPAGKVVLGKGCPAAFSTNYREGSVVTVIFLEHPPREDFSCGTVHSWFAPKIMRRLFRTSGLEELGQDYLGDVCSAIDEAVSADTRYSETKWIPHKESCGMGSVYESLFRKGPAR